MKRKLIAIVIGLLLGVGCHTIWAHDVERTFRHDGKEAWTLVLQDGQVLVKTLNVDAMNLATNTALQAQLAKDAELLYASGVL